MPISALDDFEARLTSPAALISRHSSSLNEIARCFRRATADAGARSF